MLFKFNEISSKVVFATKMLTFFAWFNLELEYLFHSSALKMYRQRFDHYSLVEDSILYVIKGIPKSCEKIKNARLLRSHRFFWINSLMGYSAPATVFTM